MQEDRCDYWERETLEEMLETLLKLSQGHGNGDGTPKSVDVLE